MLKSLNKHLLITTVCLLITLVVFEVTNLDFLVQNQFYNFDTKQWIVDRNDYVLELIFYSGVKKILILFAISILILLIFFRQTLFVKEYKKGLLIVLLSGIFIPAVIGGLKNISNTPCPKNIEYFNGKYPNVKVFESYPETFKQECKIRCWPAGHASGGFALLSLFFLFKTHKNKVYALLLGIVLGWSMGIYKMSIGDHFLSHNIVTMLLAWIIILIISKTVFLDLKKLS
ncbi:phosphatase PAP2 family protein [Sulfurimonas lithotrophica]|uniref:Phosphatase PAP2 family protein n=1 Tax=Sulfurimonas lithotrophica TaxID=2590022 RepID=A0A5P8P2K3_9BACT|nr:phosphatase PAP2 family protein [Sulfurimonas lithotrophica]